MQLEMAGDRIPEEGAVTVRIKYVTKVNRKYHICN